MKAQAVVGIVRLSPCAGSARRPFLTILLVAALAVWGWISLQREPLDAIPDLSDVQVIIFTEWMGQSPDLVEDHLQAIDRVRHIP